MPTEPTIEELSPSYVREKRIDISLPEPPPQDQPNPVQLRSSLGDFAAGSSMLLDVDYSRCLPDGVMLPLVLEIQGPSAQSYQRREYTPRHSVPPPSIIFTPREGGAHTVILREVAHNRWFGTFYFTAKGERLEAPRPV